MFIEINRNRNKYGEGKIVYVREEFIAKRPFNLEGNTSETICIEVTISKKKWCIIFVHRPPHSNNKKVFFSELTTSLNQATNKYDNIIVMGDLNIGTQQNGTDTSHYLSDLCDTFSLANLISSSTCFKSLSGTSIDVFLTNRTRRFHNTAIRETGISDHHKLITSFFRSHFERIPPKKNEYRNYNKFDIKNVLRDLHQEMIQGEMYKYNNDMYSTFSDVFRSVLDRHAPLKMKMIRGNQGPFMTKQLSKAIMNRSKLRNRYIKWISRENFLDYKKAKNTCNNLNKSAKKSYFDKVISKGFVSNKAFWNIVKPFLTNKGSLAIENITIKYKDKILTDNSKLAHLFNNHYTNIVESISRMSLKILEIPSVNQMTL